MADKRLVERLVQFECDLDSKVLEESMEIENWLEVEAPAMNKLRGIIEEKYSRKAQEKINRALYTGKTRAPIKERIMIYLFLGKQGVQEDEYFRREKHELRKLVIEEAQNLANGSPLTREQFEEAFAHAISRFGVQRFRDSEMGPYHLAEQFLGKLVGITERQLERRPHKAEKYETQIKIYNALRRLGFRWVNGFINQVLEIREKYNGDRSAEQWQAR
ncbi:hypothetical protein D6745_00455 [Candidatus Woesearchaeota archaeon]|nr:MAG: hypothetical protein D6745_00455 [Candidatus Woesearchaeota archaeon]